MILSKTNTGLAEYAKAMVGHPYWYGCFGQTSTKALYEAKKKQYPSYYTWALTSSQLGTKVFDCVGLIKGYLWSATTSSAPKYNASEDVSANGMYDKCKKKGKIDSMPKVVGTLVFKSGHVGVYVGDGKVVEAKGHKWGVVETKLSDGGWIKWGYCPWITYESAKPVSSKKYFKKYTGKSGSIVDALKAIGEQSSYSYRKKIAAKNGIGGYLGTPSQNTKMLRLLKDGKLIKP